jgi:dTDP-glucose pyrophosphorylase
VKDWRKTLVLDDTTIREAIQKLDESALQVVMVIDEQRHLKGVLTDGDIRRGIIRGISLESSVVEVMNTSPAKIVDGEDNSNIYKIIYEEEHRQVPIVNREGVVIGLKTSKDIFIEQDNWVVLMAGGLGTRLGELTKDCPKPLLQVGDKPILETIIDNFKSSGFRRFIISVNYKSEMIEQYFGDGTRHNVEIRYVREKERMGTAGSLSLIDFPIQKPLVVMNGDLLTKVNVTQLLRFHAEHKADATMCVREFDFKVPFGVVEVDGYKMSQIKEKPTQSFFVNAGIYVLEPLLLNEIPKAQVCDMPDLFNGLIKSGKEIVTFPIREYWMDIGQMDDYQKANVEFSKEFSMVTK